MPKYNNAAGRLLDVFERLTKFSNKNQKLDAFADALGVSKTWDAVLTAVQDLRDEYFELVEDIEQTKENPAKFELYHQNLPKIEKSVTSFKLLIAEKQASAVISQTGLVALRFIAADLPQDEAATENDINTIRKLVTELQQEIEVTDTFAKHTREWLLDLVRIVRDSIDRYASRGSRGMRKQCSFLLGELIQNYDLAQETQKKKPSVWKKVVEAIDVMQRVASLAEKCKPAVTFAQKCLPFLRTLGLPAPGDDTPTVE